LIFCEMNSAKRASTDLLLNYILVDAMFGNTVILTSDILGSGIEGFLKWSGKLGELQGWLYLDMSRGRSNPSVVTERTVVCWGRAVIGAQLEGRVTFGNVPYTCLRSGGLLRSDGWSWPASTASASEGAMLAFLTASSTDGFSALLLIVVGEATRSIWQQTSRARYVTIEKDRQCLIRNNRLRDSGT
jgi:hypothetical protein